MESICEMTSRVSVSSVQTSAMTSQHQQAHFKTARQKWPTARQKWPHAIRMARRRSVPLRRIPPRAFYGGFSHRAKSKSLRNLLAPCRSPCRSHVLKPFRSRSICFSLMLAMGVQREWATLGRKSRSLTTRFTAPIIPSRLPIMTTQFTAALILSFRWATMSACSSRQMARAR